jgi:hypothetical protein
MYKDRDSKGGKLIMGPLWDYTLAFGNSDYYNASLVDGFQWTYLTGNSTFLHTDLYQVPFWWKKLLNDPAMRWKLQQRWNALRADRFSYARITAIIDSLTTLLDESKQRNFLRWSILGNYVWPNYFVGKTYEEEIDYLKTWIDGRLLWLDQAFTTVSVGNPSEQGKIPERFELEQNYPNPFNPSTVISYSVPSTTGRDLASGGQLSEAGDVRLVVYDVLGRAVAVLVNEKEPAGSYRVKFDGAGLASGIYFYTLTADALVQTRKLILVR